jgi:hypothetical protein
MRTATRAAAIVVVAVGCLAGVGAREAQAQSGVPYGPYSMTRANFNRYAPVYYPRLVNNYGIGFYSNRPRAFYGGRRVFYGGYRGWGRRRW